MRYYVFEECGCRYQSSEVGRTGKRRRRQCPEHKSYVAQIELHCGCGEILFLPRNKSMTKMCPKCSQEANVRRNRERWALVPRESIIKPKMPKRKKCQICGKLKASHNKSRSCFCHDLDPDTDVGRMDFLDHPWMQNAGEEGLTVFSIDVEGGGKND